MVTSVNKRVGVWIDQKKAVIFSLADERTGLHRIAAEGRQDGYYDEVLSHLRDAKAILIFGPGEAKRELKQRLKNLELHGHIVDLKEVEKMTDNQIVTKVRDHFLNSAKEIQQSNKQ